MGILDWKEWSRDTQQQLKGVSRNAQQQLSRFLQIYLASNCIARYCWTKCISSHLFNTNGDHIMGNYVKHPEWKSKTVLALVRAIAAYVFIHVGQ